MLNVINSQVCILHVPDLAVVFVFASYFKEVLIINQKISFIRAKMQSVICIVELVQEKGFWRRELSGLFRWGFVDLLNY